MDWIDGGVEPSDYDYIDDEEDSMDESINHEEELNKDYPGYVYHFYGVCRNCNCTTTVAGKLNPNGYCNLCKKYDRDEVEKNTKGDDKHG